MNGPTGEWLELESVASTQQIARELIREGSANDVVWAHDQTSGRGRFGRVWQSRPLASLTATLILRSYQDHPRPWLLGMACALAAAQAIDCQLRWPNDLVFEGRKLGGVLTELFPDGSGRLVAAVGIGINLTDGAFPDELSPIATSLREVTGLEHEASLVLRQILTQLTLLPEPQGWDSLAPYWTPRDRTEGKTYRLATGEDSIAVGIGQDGRLLCRVDGELREVLAAEALFGG